MIGVLGSSGKEWLNMLMGYRDKQDTKWGQNSYGINTKHDNLTLITDTPRLK